MSYMAHSGNRNGGPAELLKEHLQLVANRAGEFASAFGATDEARLAGWFHDLGKYGDLFAKRLEGKEKNLDHWSAGALAVWRYYKHLGRAATLAILGHHVGLEDADFSLLEGRLDLERMADKQPRGLRPTSSDLKELIDRFQADRLPAPIAPQRSLYDSCAPDVSAMLDARMLFSALVDADYIETEAHFEGDADGRKRYRPEGPPLRAAEASAILENHVKGLEQKPGSAPDVRSIRHDLFRACLAAANSPTGLFTLTAPTGAGKTLAMLAFALRHAHEHKLRRIVMVIPYLTIIEQTAKVYRDLFEGSFGPLYVLEHHSLSGVRHDGAESGQDNEDEGARAARLLSENWDAPVIVTTSVQCLESLFANRPAACRKLHRLAKSIILFDEVQTLPPHLAVPTLAALSRLAERYGASVVFSTATQPAFTHLNQEVSTFCATGWTPQEIVPDELRLFSRARRTRVEWRTEDKTSWEDLAAELAAPEQEQALCVVNLKRHALILAQRLDKRGAEGVFHLSTNMCPAHRVAVLKEVRQRLTDGRPCRLVSTQCVEAGVDVDFPMVYRAFGPLDAIAQAAGRCNREGKRSELGRVVVFHPSPEPGEPPSPYPPGGYAQAADTTRILLAARGGGGMDIQDPELFAVYYQTLYDLAKCAKPASELRTALEGRDFEDVAKHYRLITQDAVNVLVPYHLEMFEQLKAQLSKAERLTRDWIRDAYPHSVSLFRPKLDALVWHFLDPAPIGRGGKSTEWFVYMQPEGIEHYSQKYGLMPPAEQDTWMV